MGGDRLEKNGRRKRVHMAMSSCPQSRLTLPCIFPPMAWRPSSARWFCKSINPFGDKETLPTEQPQEFGFTMVGKGQDLVWIDLPVVREPGNCDLLFGSALPPLLGSNSCGKARHLFPM